MLEIMSVLCLTLPVILKMIKTLLIKMNITKKMKAKIFALNFNNLSNKIFSNKLKIKQGIHKMLILKLAIIIQPIAFLKNKLTIEKI